MSHAGEDDFHGASQLSGLIETIYAAVEEPSLWASVLDSIAEAANGRQTFMFTDTEDPAMPKALIGTRTDPAALDQLINYYGAINVFSEPAESVYRDGDTRYSHVVVSDAELERTEFYNDFFKPFDMHYSYGINVPVDGQSPVYISCQRPKGDPAFGDREGRLLQTLKPHIRRAFTLHRSLVAANSKAAGLETAIDAFEHAVFGLDSAGRVMFCNRSAEAIVRAGDPIRLVHGVLRSIFPMQDQRLRDLISGVATSNQHPGSFSGGSLLLDRISALPALRLTVSPLAANLPGRRTQTAALVYVSDPSKTPQARSATLCALYGLTPTEARVADLLLQGNEVRQIGNQLGVTLETARFNVKRILSKTGTGRQAELIRLMLSLPRPEP